MSSVDYMFWDPSVCGGPSERMVDLLLQSMDERLDEPPVPSIAAFCGMLETRFGPEWEFGPCLGDHQAFGPAVYVPFYIYGDSDYARTEEILRDAQGLGLNFVCVS